MDTTTELKPGTKSKPGTKLKAGAVSAVALGVVVAIGGCRPVTGSQASAGASPAPSAAASATGAAASAAPGYRTGSGGASNVTRDCATGQVGVDIALEQAASGHRRMTLGFVNTGSSSCVLEGYPGAAVESKTGTVFLNATRGAGGYSPVVMAPGGRASAILQWEGFPADGSKPTVQNCPGMDDSRLLLVTPPDNTAAAAFPVPPDVCWGFSVGPVVSGAPSTTQGEKPSCPVAAQTLIDAITGDAVATRSFAEPVGLRQITCDQGFATALTTAPGTQSMAVLLGFQGDSGAWRVLAYGSSLNCSELVPLALVNQIPHCGS